MTLDRVLGENRNYSPRQDSKPFYSKAFEYLNNTSVTEGIDDLVAYMKKDAQQTAKDLFSTPAEIISQFKKNSIAKLQRYTSSQPQLAMVYAGKMAQNLNPEQQEEMSQIGYDMIKNQYGKFDSSKLGKKASGFTLTELLITIAIIAILAGLLMPALTNSTEVTRRTVCMNNQKQIGLTMIEYQDDYNLPDNFRLPTHGFDYVDGLDRFLWFAPDQTALGMLLKPDSDGTMNDPIMQVMACPSNTRDETLPSAANWGSGWENVLSDYSYVHTETNLDSDNNPIKGKKQNFVIDYGLMIIDWVDERNHDAYVNVLHPDGHAKGEKEENEEFTENELPEFDIAGARVMTNLDEL